MAENFTIVTERFVRGHCNHRLRFGQGRLVSERQNGIRLYSFRPFTVFGLVRWRRSDYGTILWNLYICETCEAGRITEIPGVYPGAELLFRSRGTKATRRLLARLTRLEKKVGGDLSAVPASYWRQYNQATILKDRQPKVSPYLEHSHA